MTTWTAGFSPQEASALVQTARQLTPQPPQQLDQLSLAIAQALLKLDLTRDNFGQVYPTPKDQLEDNPLLMLDFLRPQSLLVTEEDDQLLAQLDLDCD